MSAKVGLKDFTTFLAVLLQLADVRDYNREAAPLGVIPVQEELVSEQDEGLTSDEGGSPPHDTCLHSCGTRILMQLVLPCCRFD